MKCLRKKLSLMVLLCSVSFSGLGALSSEEELDLASLPKETLITIIKEYDKALNQIELEWKSAAKILKERENLIQERETEQLQREYDLTRRETLTKKREEQLTADNASLRIREEMYQESLVMQRKVLNRSILSRIAEDSVVFSLGYMAGSIYDK